MTNFVGAFKRFSDFSSKIGASSFRSKAKDEIEINFDISEKTECRKDFYERWWTLG